MKAYVWQYDFVAVNRDAAMAEIGRRRLLHGDFVPWQAFDAMLLHIDCMPSTPVPPLPIHVFSKGSLADNAGYIETRVQTGPEIILE